MVRWIAAFIDSHRGGSSARRGDKVCAYMRFVFSAGPLNVRTARVQCCASSYLQVTRLQAQPAQRKRGGDSAARYFTATESVAGLKDMRFQKLMPDILHWLGIRKMSFPTSETFRY